MEKEKIIKVINKALSDIQKMKKLTLELEKSIKYHTYRRTDDKKKNL